MEAILMNDAYTRFNHPLRWILISLCLSSALLITPASAEIYKWTDANGEVQYSQIPPPNGIKSEEIQSAPPPTDNPDTTSDTLQEQVDAMNEDIAEQEIEEKKDALAKQIDDAYESNCTTATNNLAKLQEGGRKRYLTPDGKVTRLTEEQRQQRINEAKNQIDEFCKP
jgi:hypothetical protein